MGTHSTNLVSGPSEASQDESQVGRRMKIIIRTKSFDVREDSYKIKSLY